MSGNRILNFKLDGFEISNKIGSGTHGTVFKASDSSGNLFAIKVLRDTDTCSYQRFLNENYILTQVDHRGIIQSKGSGTTDTGIHYMVMEYFDGINFREFLQKHDNLSLKCKVTIILSIAEAIGAAHAAGFVHRDIKPSNLLINPKTAEVKITDFGIALVPDSTLTQPINMMGTPCYMSPEGFESPKVNAASDVYSLGAIAYEFFLGRPLFDYMKLKRIQDMRKKAISEKPLSPREIDKDFPDNLTDALEKMLEKKPAKRYQDCNEVVTVLKKVLLEGFQKRPSSTKGKISLKKKI